MMHRALLVVFVLLVLGVSAQAWAENSPVAAINSNDHSALVTYFSSQAKELHEKAKHWEVIAEAYEKHQEPVGKMSAAEHAAHCRAIAKDYHHAANQAEALAIEHRGKLPHGTVR